MFTEKIFGYTVSPNTDSYTDYKKVAKILDSTFGKDVTLDSYFNHSNSLELACNQMSKDNTFYKTINQNLSFMKDLTTSKKKDSYDKELKRNIYLQMKSTIYEKICAEIIVPHLKTLNENQRSQYIQEILEATSDDKTVQRQLEDTISNYYSMDDKELTDEKKRISRKVTSLEAKSMFIEELNNCKDCKSLVSISKDGRTISPKSNPNIRINDSLLQEKVLSQLYFEEKSTATDEAKKKYTEQIINICENKTDNDIEFQDNIKGDTLGKRKELSALKYTAKENGYLVLNLLDECNEHDNLTISAIKQSTKDNPLSFQDLKKVYEKYTITYEITPNNRFDMKVINREDKSVTNDIAISSIAKFGAVWAEATGVKWVQGENIPGETYAFNEESEKIYNDMGELIRSNMNETGMIDTKAIFEKIGNDRYKHSKEIMSSIFQNPEKLKIVYDFYKMQNSEAKIETQLSKTSDEFIRGYDEKTHTRETANQMSLSMDSLKRDRHDSRVTSSEASKTQQVIKDRVQSRTLEQKQSEYEMSE